MSIEEKKRPIEFEYIPDNPKGDIDKFNIIYNPDQSYRPLNITCGAGHINCPVELLVEIVDFLTGKGIIKPSFKKLVVQDDSKFIPLPIIEGEQEEDNSEKEKVQSEPITSFDVSNDIEEVIKDIVEEDVEEGIKIQGEKKEEEIIKRQVIRSKSTDDDPLKAEREAAELRGKKKSNFKRVDE